MRRYRNVVFGRPCNGGNAAPPSAGGASNSSDSRGRRSAGWAFCNLLFQRLDITCSVAFVSAALYWAAFATTRLSLLAWFVPALWTFLVRREENDRLRFETRRPHMSTARRWLTSVARGVSFYTKIWCAGAAFWLASFSWIASSGAIWAIAVWATFSIGLGALLVPLIGVSRLATHRLGIPVIVAVPVVWCGLEWIRKNWFVGGFCYGSLEHTQYRNPAFLQGADICGEYGIGMAIVFVGACIGRLLPAGRLCQSESRLRLCRVLDTRRTAVGAAGAVLLLATAYGSWRLSPTLIATQVRRDPVAVVALLQGNVDNVLGSPPEMVERRFAQYARLCADAAPNADLVVWPEESCPAPLYEICDGFVPDEWKGEPRHATEAMLQAVLRMNRKGFTEMSTRAGAPLLLGVKTSVLGASARHDKRNSAVLVDPLHGVGPRYDKIQLAPFLEYDPFPELLPGNFPGVERYSPGVASPGMLVFVSANARRGPLPRPSWRRCGAASFRLAVNVCFESSFPHFIRRQVCEMRASGEEPDVLVNMSDDGSPNFTMMIAMHLATHVFRAIENRKQYLSADHGGSSIWIDGAGRIVREGAPGAATFVLADVYRERTTTFYQRWGDWLPISCMLLSAGVALVALFGVARDRIQNGGGDL